MLNRYEDYSVWLDKADLPEGNFNHELESWKRDKLYEVYAGEIDECMKQHAIYKIFEMGCGAGLVPRALKKPPIKYLGLDSNFKCVMEACGSNTLPTWLSFHCEDFRKFNLADKFDLACSFAVLKHFSLDEWQIILKKLLSYGHYGLFTLNMSKSDMDDGGVNPGATYHHIWVSEKTLYEAVLKAGHVVNSRKERWRGTQHDVEGWEEIIFTEELS